MITFQVGDTARIIEMPEEGRHLINKIVTICPIGGYGWAEDEVCAQLEEGGGFISLKEHPIVKIECCREINS